jgi:hypothetical protein
MYCLSGTSAVITTPCTADTMTGVRVGASARASAVSASACAASSRRAACVDRSIRDGFKMFSVWCSRARCIPLRSDKRRHPSE